MRITVTPVNDPPILHPDRHQGAQRGLDPGLHGVVERRGGGRADLLARRPPERSHVRRDHRGRSFFSPTEVQDGTYTLTFHRHRDGVRTLRQRGRSPSPSTEVNQAPDPGGRRRPDARRGLDPHVHRDGPPTPDAVAGAPNRLTFSLDPGAPGRRDHRPDHGGLPLHAGGTARPGSPSPSGSRTTATPRSTPSRRSRFLVNNVAPTATLTNDGPVGEGTPAVVGYRDPMDPLGPDDIATLHYSFALSPSGLAETYQAAGKRRQRELSSSPTTARTPCTAGCSTRTEDRTTTRPWWSSRQRGSRSETPAPTRSWPGARGSRVRARSSTRATTPTPRPWTTATGRGVQPLPLASNKTFAYDHTYATTGDYTVTVTVTDDDGGVGTDTAQVTIGGGVGRFLRHFGPEDLGVPGHGHLLGATARSGRGRT